MFRALAVICLTLATSLAYAEDVEAIDKAWSTGKPWPAHWGRIKYPYTEGWNVVLVGFVNKVYDKDEAADTWLKHIPSAMPKGASVEVCMMKRGLLELASWCQPAVVDREIVGTLNKDDVVAFFYPNHGTKRFSSGPGSDPRTTLRVFQKISSSDDTSCWVREALVFRRPIAESCFKSIDTSLVERLLTRDFGPRNGGNPEDATAAVADNTKIDRPEVKPEVALVVPASESNIVESKPPESEIKPSASNVDAALKEK